jgi:iron complex transport system permease protein
MKVTVDLEKMLQENRISREEYEQLKQSAAKDTGSLAMNILLGFGVIATAGGTLALLHSAQSSIVLGAALGFVGVTLNQQSPKSWGLLSSILLLVGALLASGGILYLTDAKPAGFLVVTALLFGAGIWARSGLLVSMATLALAPTLGAATTYGHATYTLIIEQPTLTVVLFSLLAWGAYRMSHGLEPELQRLALISARTSILLVNFGFWVGSLWGDTFGRREYRYQYQGTPPGSIPDSAFAVFWAVVLVATGVWAAGENRRWVVNTVSVFGAIHLYTQYFELLGATPGSLLIAGLGAIAIAMALIRYNKGDAPGRPRAPATAG